MKKVRVFSAILAVLTSVSVFSCGKHEETPSDDSETPDIVTETEAVTVTETETQTETSTEAETEPQTETETARKIEITDEIEELTIYYEEPTEEETTVYTPQYTWTGGYISLNDYITFETPTPPLWRVTDSETGNELYLMGTIHSVGDSTFPLSDTVNEIYQNCDGIIVEYDINALSNDAGLMQEFSSYMMYNDGTTIKDHISEETYEKAKNYLTSQLRYSPSMDNYTAAYWYNAVAAIPTSRVKDINSNGVDSAFLTDAVHDGKDIVSVEDLQTQANTVAGYSDELAEFFIESTIGDYSEYEAVRHITEKFADMYNAWAFGYDDDMLEIEHSKFSIPEELADEYAEYEDMLLTRRNQHMAEVADEFLRNGRNYFFMVGSLHYSGDSGVDDILRSMGYTVEKIA